MYPRINPKTNNFCAKVKNSLSILEDDHTSKSKYLKSKSYFDDGIKTNKTFKFKTHIDQNVPEKIDNHLQLTQLDSTYSTRHSQNLNQLPEKFNHLRGKRRSLKIALLLYEQIQDQKQGLSPIYGNCSLGKRSLRKICLSETKKTNSFYKLSSSRLSSSHKRDSKNQVEPLRLKQLTVPLCDIRNHEANRSEQKRQEYNFIGKPVRRRSFFKNRIIDQVLQNTIDQWQHEPSNDQNELPFYF